MVIVNDRVFDEERALYHLTDATVTDCVFDGPADGESALKESEKIRAERCRFALRYPLWHARDFSVSDSSFAETSRAPVWYSEKGTIRNCEILGVKFLRECREVTLEDDTIRSPEFGWHCRNLAIDRCEVTSEYFLFASEDVRIRDLSMTGKYSFQYVKNMTIENATLRTKDAFWHTKDVTVRNATVIGEYLGWYSENLTLIDCHIVGTQPLCYCKGLRLVRCTTEDCDLSFEYSDLDADIRGGILSVKNPRAGRIVADRIDRVITDGAVMATSCEITERNKK